MTAAKSLFALAKPKTLSQHGAKLITKQVIMTQALYVAAAAKSIFGLQRRFSTKYNSYMNVLTVAWSRTWP